SAPERLVVKLQAIWQEISDASEATAKASAAAQQTPSLVGSVRATRDQYDETTRALLVNPLSRFLQVQPLKSGLEAMQICDQEITPVGAHSRTTIDARFQRLAILEGLA